MKTHKMPERDYTMFEADLSGSALNVKLLRRLLNWLKPYKSELVLSSVVPTAAADVLPCARDGRVGNTGRRSVKINKI